MKFDKNNWKSIDINIDSLWIIGPRAKGGKRENNYYGNFVPQIPDHLIRRYTEPGDIVLEPFMGSGTTLYECESLGRNYIGFDINEEIIQCVQSKMGGDTSIDYSICLGDVCDEALSTAHISRFLKGLKKQRVDFVLSHPPYWDIVKFTDNEADLSQSKTLDRFLSLFLNSTKNTVKYFRSGKHFAIVVGDLYRDGEIVPLAFYMMDVIKKNIKCKLKGIVVKDIVGNRGKMGTEGLWRYRTLKSDTFLFKHEYIFLFKKG